MISNIGTSSSKKLSTIYERNKSATVNTVSESPKEQVQRVDVSRFSRWKTKVGLAGCLPKAIRFIKNIRSKQRNSTDWEDYKKSELLLLQQAQTKSISDEEKWKWELGRDENQIWRCNGRALQTQLPRETRCPIHLQRTNYITKLIIQY
ncbi:unnamed protein product [Gongylonema pulchrum]|uniref:Uncharacterized protein n=1 Tax=Gongylonema pulchrum TaxID=637853 RepID=A0A183DSP4_9BILA|nr:unnamed protein product [Gongylonema pulchrum]